MRTRGETTTLLRALPADQRGRFERSHQRTCAEVYFYAALADYLRGDVEAAELQMEWASEAARIGLGRTS